MQQKTLSLLQFQKKFGNEKACQKQLFRLRWPDGFKCPRCGQTEAYFHRKRTYISAILRLPSFIDRRHRVSQDQNLLTNGLADLLMGRQKSASPCVDATDVGDQDLQNRVDHGHKIRKALADRMLIIKLAGLIEMDDTYFGAPKPGKRGRGAAGKAKW